jgi:hypothetical protein
VLTRRTALKAGKPLARRTPLTARTPLKASGRLAQVSPRKTAAGRVAHLSTFKAASPAPAVPPEVRAALSTRSDGWCEIRLPGCLGRATDPCHRDGRGTGGRKGAAKDANARLSNVLHGCRRCHSWSHANPAKSYGLGLMLRHGQDPTAEPVTYRGRRVYLGDDGTVTDYREANT